MNPVHASRYPVRMARITALLFNILMLNVLLSGTASADALDDGLAAFERGDYRTAATALEEASAEHPRDADLFYLLGLSYQNLDRHTDAVGALRRAAGLQPDMDGVHQALGISYYRLELYANSRDELQKAVRRNPDNGTALLFLGLAYRELGDNPRAVDNLEKAAGADPELAQVAWFNIGLAYQDAGRVQAGRSALRKAIAADPGSDLAADARSLLEEPTQPMQTPPEKKRKWSLSGGVGLEYDDNVTTDEVDLTSEQGDLAGVFELSASYTPLETEKSDIELGYDLYQSLYTDLSDFDLQLHNFSAIGSHTIGPVDAGLTYLYTYARLGGDSFFKVHNFSPSAGFSLWPNWYHTVGFNYQDKNFTDNNARDADQYAIDLNSYYFFADQRSYGSIGVRLEDEDTTGPEFDYKAYYLTLGLSSSVNFLGKDNRLRFSYRYYNRNYSNITPGIGAERSDKRHTISLQARRPLTEHLSVELNYRYISSKSNLITNDFSENIISVFLRGTL